MRRPPARRSRPFAGALIVVAACGGGASRADPAVVAVAAQPCDTPNRSRGLGVVVADGIVATAAHTVEGDLRELTVDGAPATVAVLDRRTDLALLSVDLATDAAELATDLPDEVRLLGRDGPQQVEILRTGTLVVHDATDEARYQRMVHTFAPGVRGGTSGAPLVDEDGGVLGLVVLDNPTDGVAYAVAAAEIAALLGRPPAATGHSAPGECSG